MAVAAARVQRRCVPSIWVYRREFAGHHVTSEQDPPRGPAYTFRGVIYKAMLEKAAMTSARKCITRRLVQKSKKT